MKNYKEWFFAIAWICIAVLSMLHLADALIDTSAQNIVIDGKEYVFAFVMTVPGVLLGLYSFFTGPENSAKEILLLSCRTGLIIGSVLGFLAWTKEDAAFALQEFSFSFFPVLIFGSIVAVVTYSGEKFLTIPEET